MSAQCQRCNKASATLKRCSSCSSACYCSPACQKEDWPIHLLTCNIGRPLTSADYLGAAIGQGLAPTDIQTRRDYGFTQTPRPDDVEMRMGVYTLLIRDLDIKTKAIHRWREEGNLGTMMKRTFDTKLSPSQRQDRVYQWFSRVQSTFGSIPPQDDTTKLWLLDAHREAREFIARTTSNVDFNRISALDHFDNCFLFFTLLLQGARPSPCDNTGNWISFGFCGCSDLDEEAYFANQYRSLFHMVSFEEFFNAYTTSSLPSLFSARGRAIDGPYILDALGDRAGHKSVWDLKEFVCADDDMRKDSKPILPICADYGFFNCRNSTEETCLREVYRKILDHPGSNPLALHQACLRGEISDYCRGFTNLTPPEKFRRLMKNLYPLPNIEETPDSQEFDESSARTETHSPDFGDGPPLFQGLASQPPQSGRIEQSDLRTVLQSAWQSRFG